MLWTIVKVMLIVAVVIAVFAGLAVYAYNSIEVDSSGINTLVLEFGDGNETLAGALGNLTLGKWLTEGVRIIQGVRIDGTVDVRNPFFLPLYVPALEHNLSIEGEPIGSPIRTPSFWLSPGGNNTVAVSTTVPRDLLPGIILRYIFSGGSIDITVESTTEVAGISVTKTQTIPYTVTNPVVSILLGSNPASTMEIGRNQWLMTCIELPEQVGIDGLTKQALSCGMSAPLSRRL